MLWWTRMQRKREHGRAGHTPDRGQSVAMATGRHVQMDAVRQMLTAKELAVHAYLEALLDRSIEPQVLR